MLDNLIQALKEMKEECQSRPESIDACEGCPYVDFCSRDYSVFTKLPQNLKHPLLDN